MVRSFLFMRISGSRSPAETLLEKKSQPIRFRANPQPTDLSGSGSASWRPNRTCLALQLGKIHLEPMDALQGLGGRDGKSRGFHRSLHRNALVCQNLAAIPLPHRRYHRKHCATRTLFRQDSQLHKRRTLGSDHRGIVGVLFPNAPGFAEGIARHPSQLYAAALEGLLTFAFVQWRFWKTDVTTRVPGRMSGEFLILYSVMRIVDEFFREPDASLIMGMSRGQYYSLFLAAAGIVLCMWRNALPAPKAKQVKPRTERNLCLMKMSHQAICIEGAEA